MDLQELADRVVQIDERTAVIAEKVAAIQMEVQKPALTIDDICREYLHRSRRWAYERPWSLPRFGQPDVPGKPAVWFRATCDWWYSAPLEVRRDQGYRRSA